VEPRIFADRLWIVGMAGTQKFRDLGRDPRFCLHTATVDTHLTEGDAKLFGVVEDVQDPELHERFAVDLFEESGFDLRGQVFAPFYGAILSGAAAVAVGDGHMEVTVWRPGEEEHASCVSTLPCERSPDFRTREGAGCPEGRVSPCSSI